MTVTSVHRAGLWLRTVRHLRPTQVVHRLRLRGQRLVVSAAPAATSAFFRHPINRTPSWPEGYESVDARLGAGFPGAGDNADGRFEFLNERRHLGDPPDWTQADASHLWRYHLHYFEWAWAFAAHPDREWAAREFARLWMSWRSATGFGQRDAWSPYVVSLRAWVLCGVFRPLVSQSAIADDYLRDVAVSAGFVRRHLELDVGGNHLLKNLKALVGLGVFLGDESLVGLAERHLTREIQTQVLPDGGHFERSPSYHCQVLGDLIDMSDLLAAADRPAIAGLDDAIAAMRGWLGAMCMPDGDVALFNDCTLVGKAKLALLGPTGSAGRLTVLRPSGYVVMRPDERIHLVADVGPPCPPSLPAHAHADCLSFEMSVDGRRVVVDTGTSTYAPGPRRDYERSTRAHNTVEIDGTDQTEVWATFRAGRRAHPALERAVDQSGVIEVSASHDGYRRLPGVPRHRRTWRVTDGRVEIIDELLGTGQHEVAAHLHLAGPATPVTDGADVTTDGLSVHGPASLATDVTGSDHAIDFGRQVAGHTLRWADRLELPVTLRTTIRPVDAGGSRREP